MNLDGQLRQEGIEVLFVGCPQALKVDGDAAVRVVAVGLIDHRQLAQDLLHSLGASALRGQQRTDAAGGVHEHIEVQRNVGIRQALRNLLVSVRHGKLVAVGAGGGQQRLAAVPGHAAPSGADCLHAVRQIQLAVRGDGVKAMCPGSPLGELFIDPRQHGRRLSPGGGEIGPKGSGGGPLGHADVICHSDVALALRDVGKRQGSLLLAQLRCAPQPQGPHQHLGHLAPGDGGIGPESTSGVQNVHLYSGFDLGVPGMGSGHVGKGRRCGSRDAAAPLLTHHPVQDPDELCTGHGICVSEGIAVIAVHQAVVHRLLDIPGQGTVRRDILVSPCGRRRDYRQRHRHGDAQQQRNPSFHHATSPLS